MLNSPSVPEVAFERPQELILTICPGSILLFSMSWMGTSASLLPVRSLWSTYVYPHHDTGIRNRRLTILVELSPWETDVLDHECSVTRVYNVDDDPLGIRRDANVLHEVEVKVNVLLGARGDGVSLTELGLL